MRGTMIWAWLLVLGLSASAAELDTQAKITKTGIVATPSAAPVAVPMVWTEGDAIPVDALPFLDSGSTCGQSNQFDLDCDAAGPGSPDVLYSFLAPDSGYLRIDLCGSSFDTKLIAFVNEPGDLACNDDAYLDEICGVRTSLIPAAPVNSGEWIHIVVDGYGGDCGDYVLNISWAELPDDCMLACEGFAEGEPALGDGYIDQYNGGCNSAEWDYPFLDLDGDAQGRYTLCGSSGWYDTAARDTDWFIGIVGADGSVEWTLDAEQWTIGKVLSPLDCGAHSTAAEIMAGPCRPASLSVTGTPGDLVWFWIAPVEFVPPAAFDGHEYRYVSSFEGLQSSTIATQEASWGLIKSLYR